MDPDVALARLQATMPKLRAWVEAEEWHVSPADLHEHDDDLTTVVDAFEALDEWLARGGFPPKGWNAGLEQDARGVWHLRRDRRPT
jgi:hypothetical protein